MGAMGGIGMLSAGVLGGPGIGYTQDINTAHKLEELSPAAYEQVASAAREPLPVLPAGHGLDGADGGQARAGAAPSMKTCGTAEIYGKQQALKITAMIPAAMAVGYLILLIYFRAIGGYKLVEIGPGGEERETTHEPTAAEAIYQGLARRSGLTRCASGASQLTDERASTSCSPVLCA